MLPRFYCPDLPSAGSALLTDAEAHHVRDVLRTAIGISVELFDGRGRTAEAVIRELKRHEVRCELISTCEQKPLPPSLTLATAVPKGERFDWLVEKATELGVTRLIPLQTERSSVDPRDSKLARLRQTIIAACKQSRRAWLMDLTEPVRWDDFIRESREGDLFVADPQGETNWVGQLSCRRSLHFAIGPEGGFAPSEIEAAVAQGARRISLGQTILRIETAGICLASMIRLQSLNIESGFSHGISEIHCNSGKSL